MATLSVDQIAQVAAGAGFTGDALVQMVAIAMRESRGNADAIGDANNPRKGCHSYGLWQINVCPGREKAGPPYYADNPALLLDPSRNAAAAFARSSGGRNLGPWTTYRAGIPSAGPFIPEARAAVAKLSGATIPATTGSGGLGATAAPTPGLGLPSAITDPLAALSSLSDFAAQLTTWDTWRRILYVVGGLALVLAGIAVISTDSAL